MHAQQILCTDEMCASDLIAPQQRGIHLSSPLNHYKECPPIKQKLYVNWRQDHARSSLADEMRIVAFLQGSKPDTQGKAGQQSHTFAAL